MIYLISWIVFTYILILYIYIYKHVIRKNGSFLFSKKKVRETRLNVSLILMLSFYLYSISVPISRLFFSKPDESNDIFFLISYTLAYLGLFFSLLFFMGFNDEVVDKNSKIVEVRNNRLFYFSILIFLVYITFIKVETNFSLDIFFRPYSTEGIEDSGGLTHLLPIFLISALLYLNLLVLKANNIWRLNKLFIRLITFLFVTYYLIRGGRNLILILFLPIILMVFRDKIVKTRYIFLTICILYVFSMLMGAMRNFGIIYLNDFSIENYTFFDPLNQELGVGYSVISKYNEMPNSGYYFGKTYTYNIISNLVPSFVGLEKSPGPAIDFSMRYFEVSNVKDLKEGLGFSPVLEALMNFSVFGVFFMFFIIGSGISLFQQWIAKFSYFKALGAYLFLAPMVINFNRIDLATVVKMYLVLVFFFFILDLLNRKSYNVYQVKP